MAVLHMTNSSSLKAVADFANVWMEGYRINQTISATFEWKAFLPIDVASLFSIGIVLSGILGNAFIGLYVGEKIPNPSGVRTLLCNQIVANLIALFSYAFVPIQVFDRQPVWYPRLCKLMPSMGFFGVSVSLTNVAALCVSYYQGKRDGKFGVSSPRTSCIVVVCSWLLAFAVTVPLALSLTVVDVKVNRTRAAMCAAVWLDGNKRDAYMNWVLVMKYAGPILVILTMCIKTEFLGLMKSMMRCREIASIFIDVLATTCFLLLCYLFPLSKASFLGLGPTLTIEIVLVLEVLVLANCAIIPMLLAAFVDEYNHSEQEREHIITKVTDHFNGDVEKDGDLEYPGNASCVTYDALIADMPEKWRPSPSRVLIV